MQNWVFRVNKNLDLFIQTYKIPVLIVSVPALKPRDTQNLDFSEQRFETRNRDNQARKFFLV